MSIYKRSKAKTPKSSTGTRKTKRFRGRRYSPSEKQAIIKASKKVTFRELQEVYGVSSETVRRWKLRERSRGQRSSEETTGSYSGAHPNWKKVLKIWKTRPGLGPLQISNQLKREGIRINVAAVRLIMEENGYTPPKTVVKEKEDTSYEAVRPLEIIHMDFKHIYINKQKVYLLFLQDDYSRFISGYQMTESENIDAVIETFEESVNRYGRMQKVMTDAGSAFYCWNGINRFQRLLSEEYGVDHIKAGSPRSNGKVESVNKQIEKELLRIKKFSALEETDQAIEEWIEFYNFSRTHMGLPAGLVPADRFLPGWERKNSRSVEAPKPDKSGDSSPPSGLSIWEEVVRLLIKKLS